MNRYQQIGALGLALSLGFLGGRYSFVPTSPSANFASESVPQPSPAAGMPLQALRSQVAARASTAVGSASLADSRAEQRRARVAAESEKIIGEYAPLLSALGMTGEQVEQALQHRVKIFGLTVEAGDSRQALILNRKAADDQLRSILSPSNYNKLIEYEKAKYTAREMSQVQPYLGRNGVISPDVVGLIGDEIQKAGAFTTETYGGPYDRLPHQHAYNAEGAEDRLAALSRLEDRTAKLMVALENRLPPEAVSALTEYYQSRAADIQANLTMALNPEALAAFRAQKEGLLQSEIEAPAQPSSVGKRP